MWVSGALGGDSATWSLTAWRSHPRAALSPGPLRVSGGGGHIVSVDRRANRGPEGPQGSEAGLPPPRSAVSPLRRPLTAQQRVELSGAWRGTHPDHSLRAETPTDPRDSLSFHPHFPQPTPLTNLPGDGFVHCASCTGHKPQVYSKVTSTLSLPELSCGGREGGFIPDSLPGSPLGPLLTSPHSTPAPPALPKAPWSIPHVTATVWPLLSKPHSTQTPLKVPLGSSCSSDLFNKCVLGIYCVSGTVPGTRAQSRKQNRPKVLPSWNFHSEGRDGKQGKHYFRG